MTANLYALLKLTRDATPDEIKKAHRALAKKVHPDVGGLAQEFLDVQKAFEILSDPDKRTAYDRDGTTDQKANNDHRAALAVLQGLLDSLIGEVLADHGDTEPSVTSDVVACMRDEVTDRLAKFSAEIVKFERSVKRLGKLAERFKTKGQDNFLRRMVEAKQQACTDTIRGIRRHLEVHEAALTLLANQSFEFDAPRPPPVYPGPGLGVWLGASFGAPFG